MADIEGIKEKFIVIKNEDAEKYLSGYGKSLLNTVLRTINRGRSCNGKDTDNIYLVINTDEIYADEIIEIMKKYGHWG